MLAARRKPPVEPTPVRGGVFFWENFGLGLTFGTRRAARPDVTPLLLTTYNYFYKV